MYPESLKKIKRTICWIRPLDWFYFISNIMLEEQAKGGIKFVDFARMPHVLQSQSVPVPSAM